MTFTLSGPAVLLSMLVVLFHISFLEAKRDEKKTVKVSPSIRSYEKHASQYLKKMAVCSLIPQPRTVG
jgi:hypothetical protein